MVSPTQPQVIDEIWDDERIRSFLRLQPPHDQPHDFYLLNKAYQGMRAGDFRRFLALFADAGGDLDSKDGRGRTIAAIIAQHRHGSEYLQALREQVGERR